VEENSSIIEGSSPRIDFVDTRFGAVNNAPVWAIDNYNDRFRIYHQPNIGTPGSAYFAIDSSYNIGIGPIDSGLNGGISGATLAITNTGNVGIGTTRPNQNLEVTGNIRTSGGTPLEFTSLGTGTYNRTVLYHDPTNGFYIDLARFADRIAASPIDFNINARGGGPNFLTIKGNTGNVGIGTQTPQGKLDVEGGMVVNGSVGIGTTNPTASLDIQSRVGPWGGGTALRMGVYDVPSVIPGSSYDSYIQAYNGGLFLNPVGNNVAIGYPRQTNVTSRLAVNGSVSIGTSTPNPSNMLGVAGAMAVGSNYAYASAPPNGISVEGGIAIGTQSAGTYKLFISGGKAGCDQAACWTDYSSREIKKNITKLSDAEISGILKQVRNTNVYYYQLKNSIDKQTYLGVISEESPNWITTPDKKSISAGAFANFLLVGMKAQQRQIEQLVKENQQFKERISALEARK